jgi:hypothetical protein
MRGRRAANGTHRRERLLGGGPEKRCRDTRRAHLWGGGAAFEAGGVDPERAGVTNDDVLPLAIEAGPLPGSCRANGGRCCPHSSIPKLKTRRGLPKSGTALGTGEWLS